MNTQILDNSFGGRLDRALRQGQDNQTAGIPVGPDTSRIVAEIVAVAVDCAMFPASNPKKVPGLRYVDDYFLGIPPNTSDSAVAARLSSALREFELEINAGKTKSDVTGEDERPTWFRRLRSRAIDPREPIPSLRDYFDEVVSLFCVDYNDAIPKYAIKSSRSFRVPAEAVQYYIDRVIHLSRICPAAIPAVVQALLDRNQKQQLFDCGCLRDYVVESIPAMAATGQTFELVWLLFLVRGLNLSLARKEVSALFAYESSPCALVLMDMNVRGQISRGIDQSKWKQVANEQGLKGPMWLLSYEAVRKGWWSGNVAPYVQGHPLFGPMLNRGVYFYEERRNVKTTLSEMLLAMAAQRRYRYFFNHIDDYV